MSAVYCAARRRVPRNTGFPERRGTRSPQALRQIFETTIFSFDTLSQRLRELSFLNRGIVITIDDERDENKKHRFQYEGGIASFVEHLNRNKEVLHPQPIMIEGTRDEVAVEVALQWNDGYRKLYSFANNTTPTTAHHIVGSRAAHAHAEPVATAAVRARPGRPAAGHPRRRRGDHRQVPNPQFEDIQGKLGNSEVQGASRASQREARRFSRESVVANRIVLRCSRRRAPVKPRARPRAHAEEGALEAPACP